jgi:hypothetical protein
MDVAERQYNILKNENQRLVQELDKQQKQNQLIGVKLEAETEGSNSPIIRRIDQFHKSEETVRSLEKVLAVSGTNLVHEVVNLKDNLEATQEALKQKNTDIEMFIAKLQTEVGEDEGKTPPLPRVRKLSNSIKKDTNNLQDAVSVLTEKLHEVTGEDSVEKIEVLMADLSDTKEVIRTLDNRLNALPGEGLQDKIELLIEERNSAREIIISMDEIIAEKEAAYNNLYIELLKAKSESKYLDEELSKEQVAHAERRENLNDILRKQFNS